MSTADQTPGNASDSQALLRMINGFRISQMIGVAAKLGLADLMTEGLLSVADLAQRTNMHPPSLYRLLRALSSVGVFAEDEQGRFGLTPLAAPLRTGVPGSLHAWAILSCDPQIWRSWGELAHSVKTGETAFKHVFGMGVWEYRAQHPDANAIFNAAMTSLSSQDIPTILAGYDFAGVETLVDVGGGHGALMAAILQAHPTMRGILFDLPHVVATAQPLLHAAGVADRCELTGGDFFESAPRGGDAYLLRHIIHDWDDERSVAILRICHDAMTDDARLLLVDGVVQSANHPDPTKLLDINMLVMPGGLERTEAEFQALMERAGFALAQVHPTAGQTSIIEGRRR